MQKGLAEQTLCYEWKVGQYAGWNKQKAVRSPNYSPTTQVLHPCVYLQLCSGLIPTCCNPRGKILLQQAPFNHPVPPLQQKAPRPNFSLKPCGEMQTGWPYVGPLGFLFSRKKAGYKPNQSIPAGLSRQFGAKCT